MKKSNKDLLKNIAIASIVAIVYFALIFIVIGAVEVLINFVASFNPALAMSIPVFAIIALFAFMIVRIVKDLSKKQTTDCSLEQLGFNKIESESDRTKAVYANYFCKFIVTKSQAKFDLIEDNSHNPLYRAIKKVTDELEDEE